MARTYTPKVNRHVNYTKSNGRPVRAIITAVGSANGGIVLRVGNGAQKQVFGDATTGILRGPIASVGAANVVNTWRPV